MLTKNEYAWLQKIESKIDFAWDDLNSFQLSFIELMIERFHRHGRNTIISPKQWDVITEISESIF